MVVAVEEQAGIEFVTDLARRAASVCAPLTLRAGIATGHALLFEGDDYIGSAVNMAARLCDYARGVQVVGDLAYVAAGRYDGYWENGLNPWDVAAGIVLVREAGGFVSDLSGGNRMLAGGGILAANSELHGFLVRLLQEAAVGQVATRTEKVNER